VDDGTPLAAVAQDALVEPDLALSESEPAAGEAESLELDSELEIDFDAIDGEQGLEDLSAGYQPAESVAPVAEEEDPFDTRALDEALELDEPSLQELEAEGESPLSLADAELSDLDLESALLDDEPVADADLSLPEEPDFSDLEVAEGLGQEEVASLSEPTEASAEAEPLTTDEAASFRFDEFDDPFAPVATEPQPPETSAQITAEVPVLDEDADEFDFLSDADEIATKLDLARAYIDMGDTDGAREILDEVKEEGTGEQQQEAEELLGRIV
jgi:pilus assembly protein FimV